MGRFSNSQQEEVAVVRDVQQDTPAAVVAADEQGPALYDAIMIGAGISGVFNVAEAVQQGYKNILLLEKQNRVGGLWAVLPAWQTVQNDPRDFCMQGFTTRKRTWYARDVCHMLERYVAVQKLEGYLRLGRDVVTHEWSDEEGCWILTCRVGRKNTATQEVYRCRKLVLCTGKHARPFVPTVAKDDGSVPMLHSSQVHDFQPYRGKRVAVLGAGASGLDLVINSLKVKEGEKEAEDGRPTVHWLLREPRYFGLSSFRDLLPFTVLQLVLGLAACRIISFMIHWAIRLGFRGEGLEHWLPGHDFDIAREQLVPNRGYVTRNASRIDRRVGVEVVEVRDKTLVLSDGSSIADVDVLLLGTGYLPPQHDPKLELDNARFYIKAIPLGRHQGRLFLFGETLLDTTGATPISVHIMARKFWNLIREDRYDQVHEELVLDNAKNVNHMDILNHVAPISRDLFPLFVWRLRMLSVHLYYRFVHNTRVFYADRVIGLGMSLDDDEDVDCGKQAEQLQQSTGVAAQ